MSVECRMTESGRIVLEMDTPEAIDVLSAIDSARGSVRGKIAWQLINPANIPVELVVAIYGLGKEAV